jgi:hypothetical protein
MSLSRRSLFQHATSLPLAAVVPNNTKAPRSAEIERLIRRRARVIEQRDQLDAKWLRIYQQLPERYKAGRPYVGQDGIEFGSLAGWPAADDDDEAIQLSSGVSIRRPSPTDLRKLFVEEAAELSGEVAGERYRQHVSQLRKRCRSKRVCLKECGLPTSRDWETFDREMEALDVAMRTRIG